MNHNMRGGIAETQDTALIAEASTSQKSMSEEKSKIMCQIENGSSTFLDGSTKRFSVVTNFQFKMFGFSEDADGNTFFIFKCEYEKKGIMSQKEW